ncbi:MAG: response regulator [Desulfobacula sp.]|nr:response regulator [Desulfobacula sp.]
MEDNNRILIIDDDEGIRETYKGIFAPVHESDVLKKGRFLFARDKVLEKSSQPKEYDVTFAENGLKGVEFVETSINQNKRFAVAFIDMKMPGISGAQTTKLMWGIDREIKIVVVTAFSEYTPEDIIKVTGRDDIFYLRKPFAQEEILQFARTLSYEWNLEKKKDRLEKQLKKANLELKTINVDLKEKIEKQANLIVQAEKMATVGLLAAGVAHEINNPIAFINGNLSALKKYSKKIVGLNQQYQKIDLFWRQNDIKAMNKSMSELSNYKIENKIDIFMEDIDALTEESIEGIDRIKNIVQDLKNFSRIDEAEYKEINLNNSIETTLNIIWNEIKYKAEIKKDYGDLPLLKCFPQKISQMFMNLLLNASQAIENKGDILISTKLITKGRRTKDQYIEVTISDSGSGIPKEHLNRIFDPFFTTKPEGEGTGLGLSIVYDIIKAHNGQISVSSDSGNGSKFLILFPVYDLKPKFI